MNLALVRSAERGTAEATLHCSGCGRRLVEYADLGPRARIRGRCRDCKTTTTLLGVEAMLAYLATLDDHATDPPGTDPRKAGP